MLVMLCSSTCLDYCLDGATWHVTTASSWSCFREFIFFQGKFSVALDQASDDTCAIL